MTWHEILSARGHLSHRIRSISNLHFLSTITAKINNITLCPSLECPSPYLVDATVTFDLQVEFLIYPKPTLHVCEIHFPSKWNEHTIFFGLCFIHR